MYRLKERVAAGKLGRKDDSSQTKEQTTKQGNTEQVSGNVHG